MKKGFQFKKDICGEYFGSLKVLEFSHTAKRRSYWKCKCNCGNTITVSRKKLMDKGDHSCGCVPRAVLSRAHGLRSWEECVKYKMNCIFNKSKWRGHCLIWDSGCFDDNGFPKTSFLNYPVLVKDFLWFLENKRTIGKCRIIMICGNRSCINVKHMGVEYYGRDNKTLNRLLEISKNRWKQELV